MKLRVIDCGYVSAIETQAISYGVLNLVRSADGPTLVLSRSTEPYLCIGCHQDIGLEVDEDYCRSRGIRIVRRRLGGGTVYIDSKQIIIHLLHGIDRAPRQIDRVYATFVEPVVRACRDFGLSAEYRPPSDIWIDGRKISGIAARMRQHSVVVGGTLLFDFDPTVMARCVKVPSEDFRIALKAGLERYMTTMMQLLPAPPSWASLKERLVVNAGECLGLEPEETPLSPAEHAATAAESAMLLSADWMSRRGRKFVPFGTKISAGTYLTERSIETPGGRLRVLLLERDGQIAALSVDADGGLTERAHLARIAEHLLGCRLIESELVETVASAVAKLQLQLPGISSAHFARAILSARHRET